jgi:aryl-alcohol dehydrogenase-like predicted oxidoreductase
MKTHTLGQGLQVSAIGLGCMTMFPGGNIVYGAGRACLAIGAGR